jgi:periplasmic protein TonB
MEQPFHSVRSIPQKPFTPARAAGLAAALLLQAGFFYAIVSGLAATLVQKLPDVLKVDVQQEKITPKPPPPPPPTVDLPPPPSAPPPVINIATDAPTNTITVTNKPPPPAPPPPVVHQAVTTPVSIGRAHSCLDKYPEVSVRLNEEGTTTLSFHVTTDGGVSDVSVAKSSGSERLDTAAVACAGRWHYKPQTVDGNPVETPWQAAVQWKLH